jgi:hypothetical protein
MAHEYQYNPFNKDLSELVAEDLNLLKNVSEGWYIEYKSLPQDVRNIAKTISAFANQFGGMLFIGIEEADDRSRVASKFTGLLRSDIPHLSLQIREASSAHISPAAYYEERVIVGPCDSIGLAAGCAILAIGVPQGLDAPYIHSSGRIYRRLADQSAPKEETDRHVLDLLWERSAKFRDRIGKRLERTPELPEAQVNAAIAYIYLVPDLRHAPPKSTLPLETFRKFAKALDGALADPSLPMDLIHSRDMGYTGRQVAKNDPKYATVAFHWWRDGVARMDIPLNTLKPKDFIGGKYSHSDAFGRELARQRHTDTDICDFSMLVLTITALTNLYNHLRNYTGDARPLYATFQLCNLLYKVPFFNSARYIARCGNDGVPVITDKKVIQSPEPYFDNMITIDPSEKSEPQLVPYLMSAPLAAAIMSAVGVFPDVSSFMDDPDLWVNHHAPAERVK